MASKTVEDVLFPGIASRVHSSYQRTLDERPLGSRRVVVQLRVRRYFCDRGSCSRRTFVEQVGGLTERHRRPTAPRRRSRSGWPGIPVPRSSAVTGPPPTPKRGEDLPSAPQLPTRTHLSRHRYEDIHRLLEKGWAISAIARRVDLDRKTVRRFRDTDLDQLLVSVRDRRPNGVLERVPGDP
ncbi:hypothetical protein ACWELB_37505 [Streptomyces asiaticus]